MSPAELVKQAIVEYYKRHGQTWRFSSVSLTLSSTYTGCRCGGTCKKCATNGLIAALDGIKHNKESKTLFEVVYDGPALLTLAEAFARFAVRINEVAPDYLQRDGKQYKLEEVIPTIEQLLASK